jgi:hypothetical protein
MKRPQNRHRSCVSSKLLSTVDLRGSSLGFERQRSGARQFDLLLMHRRSPPTGYCVSNRQNPGFGARTSSRLPEPARTGAVVGRSLSVTDVKLAPCQGWRRLKVTFPRDIATHSSVQTFHFDREGLLRRHDYDVDVLGGTPAAHYVHEYHEFSGILVPTRRRVLGRNPDGTSAPDPSIVTIDLNEVKFS